MWQEAYIDPLNEKGRYSKEYPFRPFDLSIPGRCKQPLSCCHPNTKKRQVVAVGTEKAPGKRASGIIRCNERGCPDCHTSVTFTDDLRALAFLLACLLLHPGSSVYSGRFHFADSENMTQRDLNKARELLNEYLNKLPGVFDWIIVPHSFRIKKAVKSCIISQYLSEYGKLPNGTTIYTLASDIDYLHYIGFTDFKIWQDATEPFFHFHVFAVADHYPREAFLHGNQKISISRILRHGFASSFIDSSSEKSDLLLRNSRLLVPSTQALEGEHLVRFMHYTLSHCIVSDTKGLSFQAFTKAGTDAKNIHLDINSNPEGLNPDPIVAEAFELLRKVFPYLTWKGKFVYPSREAPTINEALPSNNPPKGIPEDFVNVRVFYIPTQFKDGKRVLMEGAEAVFKRQDLYVSHLKSLELMGLLPVDFPVKLSDSFSSAFATLNAHRLDSDLKATDRVLYNTDFPGFEDHAKAGFEVDLGHISKALAYKPATDSDYEIIDTMLADTARHKNKPCRKHEHINPRSKKDKQRLKEHCEFWDRIRKEEKLKESLIDGDFDSVEKLSWMIAQEDSTYEEEEGY